MRTVRRPLHPAAQNEVRRIIELNLDEFEALRLADMEGLYQEAAALRMGVSRQTFGRILAGARKKSIQALLEGSTIRIAGGTVRLANQGETPMKIAVPVAGKTIDAHFGHCESYAVFTVANSRILEESTLPSLQGCGCKSGIAPILARNGITLMIAGNIGNGAINVLASNGIKTLRGASGDARAAVEAYLEGRLADSGETCQAHAEHGDGEAGHVCSH